VAKLGRGRAFKEAVESMMVSDPMIRLRMGNKLLDVSVSIGDEILKIRSPEISLIWSRPSVERKPASAARDTEVVDCKIRVTFKALSEPHPGGLLKSAVQNLSREGSLFTSSRVPFTHWQASFGVGG
jgi:hypothetical protein